MKKAKTYDGGNQNLGLGQTHISGVVKPIDWLLIISLLTFEYVILI
jgi:hypothetical protein